MKLLLHIESYAILLFCSDLIPTDVAPLTKKEWQEVEDHIALSVKEGIASLFGLSYEGLTQVVGLSDEISHKILAREKLMPMLFYALHNLEQEGIALTTIYEDDYPDALRVLKEVPPILYYVGDLSLLDAHSLALASSASPDGDEKQLMNACLMKILIEHKTLLCTNREQDDYMRRYVLNQGGKVIEFVADHMVDQVKKRKRYINKKTMLIICHHDPYGYVSKEKSMERDLSLCALSHALFVTSAPINSQIYESLVTNLHFHYAPLLVMTPRDMYDGNLRLLEMGALPLTLGDLASDLTIASLLSQEAMDVNPIPDQMSIFDFIKEKHDEH